MQHAITSKALLLQLSQPQMFKFCFSRCLNKKPGSNLSAAEQNCFDMCNAKVINAYSFMIDVVEAGGIKRDSTVHRMKGSF